MRVRVQSNTSVSDLNDKLLDAVKRESVEEMIKLIDAGAEPSEIIDHEDGKNLLHVVADWSESSRLEAWKLLVEHGVRMDLADKHGMLPIRALYWSKKNFCFRDTKDVIRLYNTDHVDSLGYGRLLLEVVLAGKYELSNLLLKAGADPNAVTSGLAEKKCQYQHYTSLHLAAHIGHTELVKLLLRYGADPSIKNKLKQTPAELAKLRRFGDCLREIEKFDGQNGESVYKFLVDTEMDVNSLDYDKIAGYKNEVLSYIFRLPADERYIALTLAKDEEYALGLLFWQRRGLLSPSLERGTLQRIYQQWFKDDLSLRIENAMSTITLPALPDIDFAGLCSMSVSAVNAGACASSAQELVPVYKCWNSRPETRQPLLVANQNVLMRPRAQTIPAYSFTNLMAQSPNVADLPSLPVPSRSNFFSGTPSREREDGDSQRRLQNPLSGW